MPRSPYDREDRKDRRYGGRINKAEGGGLFNPFASNTPLLEDALDRIRSLRQRGGGGGSGWGGEGGYGSPDAGLVNLGRENPTGLTPRYSEDLKLSMPGDRKIGPNTAEEFGLSLPQDNANAAWDNNRRSAFMGPLRKGAVRNREDRAGGLASLEDVIGPDRAVYPPNSPYSRFQDAPSNAPEYSLDVVGAPQKKWLHKDDEQPPTRMSMLRGEALRPEPQSFSRKFVLEDTSRFNKKRTNEDPENITRDSIYNPDKSNAYWQDLPKSEIARDIVKSFGTGYAQGAPDVIGLPRQIANYANMPEMFVNNLPKAEDWKKKINTTLYGENGEEYSPRTSYGRFANAAGQVSPYITAASALAATRGGLSAPAIAGGVSGMLGAALRSGSRALRENSPLAYNPIYNGFADGGSIPFGAREGAKQLSKAGLVNSASAGRADKVPGAVKAGSYVMPADVVSAMGQGNTMAGARVLNSLMGQSPFGANAAKAPAARASRGRGMTAQRMKKFADGGSTDSEVPVNVSGGEFIFPPEAVAEIGGGDIDYGHEILDALALQARQKNIKHLTKLPPPRKD